MSTEAASQTSSFSRSHLLECNLVRDLVRHLPTFLSGGSEQIGVSREVGVGRSIADVVAVIGCKRPSHLRSAPLTLHESFVLATIRRAGRALTLTDLCRPLKVDSRNSLVRLLDRLADTGLLVMSRRTAKYSLAGPLQQGFRLVAFEAKLSRWRDALEQAIAYRRYADEAYVALPAGSVRLIDEHHATFTRMGVGVVAVSQRSIETIVRPRSFDVHDWQREFVLSRVLHNVSRVSRRTAHGASTRN